MNDKKMKAKKAALMGMSSKLREDSRNPMKDELSKRKMQKVTVMAPDEKGLAKGLSKAEELIKAKFGELGLEEDEMEEIAEGDCPICGDSLEDMHEHEDEEDLEDEDY